MTQARDVADGKFTNNVLTVSSADNIVGSFESTDAVQWIAMQDSDTSSGTHVMLGAIGDDLRFRAGNNEVGRWLSGGGLAFNGDTAQANALDDYAEGTWTPTFEAATNPTVTYSARTGSYTKIGNTVAVWCSVSTDSVSGGSGSLKITGLPFTETTRNTGHVVAGTWGGDAPIAVRVSSGACFLYFRTAVNGSDIANNVQVSDMSTSSGGYNGTEFTVVIKV